MIEVNKLRSFKAKIGAGAAGILLAASMQSANAEDLQSAFVMTVIADQAQGEKMMAGDYSEAIAAITSPNVRKRDSFAASNNLCVAYTKINDLDRADDACADALRASRTMFGPRPDASHTRFDHALALSNRGVIRAITGDVKGARSDFERARRLNDNLGAASNNLARLEKESTGTVSSL